MMTKLGLQDLQKLGACSVWLGEVNISKGILDFLPSVCMHALQEEPIQLVAPENCKIPATFHRSCVGLALIDTVQGIGQCHSQAPPLFAKITQLLHKFWMVLHILFDSFVNVTQILGQCMWQSCAIMFMAPPLNPFLAKANARLHK